MSAPTKRWGAVLFLCVCAVLYSIGGSAFTEGSSAASERRSITIEIAPEQSESTAPGRTATDPQRDSLFFPSFGKPLFGPDHSGVEASLENLSTLESSLSSRRLLSPGLSPIGSAPLPASVRLRTSSASAYSPLLQSGPHPSGKIRIHYGGIPLTRFLPSRSAFRLLPNLLTSGWRMRPGLLGLNDGIDDFSPTLILIPCSAESCLLRDSKGTRHMVAAEAVGLQELDSAAAMGDTNGSSHMTDNRILISSWYLGTEIFRDTGRIKVLDDGNTPRYYEDDRVVALRNNDSHRVSGVHSAAVVVPDLGSRIESHILVTELGEGLTMGPQSVRDDSRAVQKLALGEIQTETLLGTDGDRMMVRMKGLFHEQFVHRSTFDFARPNSAGEQEWGEVGLGFLTRPRRENALRQLYVDTSASQFQSEQLKLPQSGGSERAQYRVHEVSHSAGTSWGLDFVKQGLSLVGAGALKMRKENSGSTCVTEAFLDCFGDQRRVSRASPQIGTSVNYQSLLWSGRFFLARQGRLPEPYERFGHPSGIRPNSNIRQERRVSAGASIQISSFEMGYLYANDFDLIWPVTLSNMSVRFENREKAFWHNGYVAWAWKNSNTIDLLARVEFNRAWFDSNSKHQIPEIPKIRMHAQSRFALRTGASENLGQLRSFASLSADYTGEAPLDETNLVSRSAWIQWSPGLGQELIDSSGRRLAAHLGMNFAYPETSSVRDNLGREFRDYSQVSGATPPTGPRLTFGLRGDF